MAEKQRDPLRGPAESRRQALTGNNSSRGKRRVSRSAGSPYGTAALNAALEDLAEAPERHHALYKISAAMGNLLASGQLYEESYVKTVLLDGALRRGMSGREREAERTIRDGVSAGRTTPRFPVSRAPLYNRNDATVATIMWWEAVEKAPWTTRSSANDLRVLSAFGILSLRQGKVRFSASYRQIAEEAGISVSTVHSSLRRGLKGFVRRVQKGGRFETTSSVWQLIPKGGAKSEQGLCPEQASLMFGKRTPISRPDHDLWGQWPNGWRIYTLLMHERLSARQVSMILGRPVRSVRRMLNRLRDRQLARRGPDGLWTALPPPEGAIDGGFIRARRERMHREQRELWAKTRSVLIEQKSFRSSEGRAAR